MTDYPLLFRCLLDRGKAVHFAYHLRQRRVAYVSQAYEKVIGSKPSHVNEELADLLDRIHPDDQRLLRKHYKAVLKDELVQDVELRLLQPSGSTQWLCLSACRELLADGEPYVSGTVVDVTTTKASTLHTQQFLTKKDATLEILSHDLAGPLALLQQLSEHVRLEVGTQATDPVRELLGLMETTCRDGINLIRDFVNNEFLESANVELNWERADLGAWLRTIIEVYQNGDQHAGMHFEFVTPPHPVYVNLDVNKFQQVINNLISNALKFTPDGGRISLRLQQQESQAVIEVADTGVGIPQHLQPGLFERFTKSRRPGLRGERSTGLGMSVIRTIVNWHHGRISVASTEGAGSTFTIALPLLSA